MSVSDRALAETEWLAAPETSDIRWYRCAQVAAPPRLWSGVAAGFPAAVGHGRLAPGPHAAVKRYRAALALPCAAAQSAEAVGALAAEVAHEVNNPLAVVKVNVR